MTLCPSNKFVFVEAVHYSFLLIEGRVLSARINGKYFCFLENRKDDLIVFAELRTRVPIRLPLALRFMFENVTHPVDNIYCLGCANY